MKSLDRRNFIKTASVAALAAGSTSLIGCAKEKNKNSFNINSGETYEWKMVTTWPPHFPILGEFADKIAEWIKKISNGRFTIQVYGGGELVPALETFDAVANGVVEMGHGAAYYWAGKSPAAQFFGSIPFGMNARQINAWLYYGNGLELWKELYEKFNLVPFPCGNTGGQMGGWFNKQINSTADLKGLKMRMPGLGGSVITKAGATSILSPGGELYTNLERGVIDALEWIGPYHDYLMGFHNIAKYYYYPGWHEPGTPLELIVNKSAYENLPDDFKLLIDTVAKAVNVLMLSEFEAKNAEYFYKMKNESKVIFKQFPEDVLNTFKKLSAEVVEELASSSPEAQKIYKSYKSFKASIAEWSNMVERNYL